MFSPLATAAPRNRADCGVSVPSSTRCSSRLALTTNLRMLIAQWRRVTSGMTTCSREPSGKCCIDEGRRKVQPSAGALEHAFHEVADLLLGEATDVSSDSPLRATKISSGALSQISSIAGSSSSGCNGPKPATASKTNLRAVSSGADRRQWRQQRPLVVVADRLVHQAPDFAGLPQRVEPSTADQLADLVLDDAHSFHGAPNMTATPPLGQCNSD